MSILSFEQGHRDELLRKADAAQRRRRFREAYDFLKEALRFGENAAIFDRASAILNEMGEFESATQVASCSLRSEPDNPRALWEKAFGLERLWKTEEALTILEKIRDEDGPGPAADRATRLNHLTGMCHLKRGDVDGLRRTVFRGAGGGKFPEPISGRLTRLEACLRHLRGMPPGLQDWVRIMHDRLLLTVYSRENGLSLHLQAEKSPLLDHGGEHYVIGHPSFEDCGRILSALRNSVRGEDRGYSGVYPAEPNSLPVAMAVGKLLDLPVVDMARLAAPDPVLVCLASNLGGMAARIPSRWPLRHDLFILAKSFEREEFRDVVAPPHNLPRVNVWAEPVLSGHRQIIGALGEYLSLPWEQASFRAYQAMPSPQAGFAGEEWCWDPAMASDMLLPSRIAGRLVAAAMEGGKA